MWLTLGGHAYAEPVSLRAGVCTLAGQGDISAAEGFARRADFDCSREQFNTSARHYWALVDVPDSAKNLQAPVWRIRIARYGTMTGHVLFSDGTITTHKYTLQDIEDNWRAPSAVSIPIKNQNGLVPTTLLLSIDKPWDAWNMADMALLEADEDLHLHRQAQILNIAFCCLMFAPLLLSLISYLLLRIRFVLFHAIMVTSWIIVHFLWGGMAFDIFPALDLASRSAIIHMMLAVNFAMMNLLARDMCHPDKIGIGGRKWLKWSAVAAPVATAMVLASTTWSSSLGPFLFMFIALVTTLIGIFIVSRAALRGSKMAIALMFGGSGFGFIYIFFSLSGFGVTPEVITAEQGMYGAVLFEALVYSCIVAHKGMALRRQHDLAMSEKLALFEQATRDDLTGLLNRRAFVSGFERIMSRDDYVHQNWALMVLDIDHFKRVNDTYGHYSGDVCLSQIGDILKSTFKEDAYCSRMGGEEFSILFKSNHPLEAERDANALRERVAAYKFGDAQHPIGRVTVSVGLLHLTKTTPKNFDLSYKAADAALYAAKAGGRNCMEVADLNRVWEHPEQLSQPNQGNG